MFAEILLAAAASSSSDSEAAARALAWLEPRIEAADWSKVDPSQANVGGKRIVVDAVVAWLELVRTDRPIDEALLAKLDARIRSHLGEKSGLMGGFANWTDGFAALYCIERELRGKHGREMLQQIVRGFEGRQNQEGGWDHGATFGVPFYPSTLVATTNLGLIALGFGRRFGLEVDGTVVEAGLSLLRDVQGQNGGMPYGGRPYTKLVEAGRTCGTVLALSSLGLGADPRCTRAAGYVMRNVDAIQDGHASTAFHVFVAALACSALGPAASQTYDEQVLARVRSGQRSDGTFESIVPGSPDDMMLMADEDTNRAYVSALHAAALLARGSKIADALKLASSPVAEAEQPEVAAPMKELWNVPMAGVGLVRFVGERLLAVENEGHGRWLSATDGKTTGTFELALGTEPGTLESTGDEQGLLVWKSPNGEMEPLILGGVVRSEKDESEKTTLAFVSAAESGPHWSHALGGRVTAAVVMAEHIVARTLSGRMHVLARKDGTPLRELPAAGILPNVALCAGPGDEIVVAAEAHLGCMGLGGGADENEARRSIWARRNRLRGLTPPSWTALAWGGNTLVAGRTDGSVAGVNPTDGVTRWEAQTGSSVRRVAVDASSARTYALTHDGRLVAIDAGKIVWTRDIDTGHESHSDPDLLLTRGRLWVATPARNTLSCIDPADGRILATTAKKRGTPWSAREGKLILAEPNGVRSLRIP